MNIAYILSSLANAAPIRVMELLSRLMTLHGHTCIVFYLDEKTDTLPFSCQTQRFSTKQTLDFTAYDIVHSSGLRPDRYVARTREFGGRTKYLSTIHNFFIEDFTSQYNWLVAQYCGRRWMQSLNKFDAVVTLSRVGVDYYTKWIKKASLKCVYNARVIDGSGELNEAELRQLNKFKGDSKLIGINALLSPVKGIDQVIRSLVFMPDYKLFIVGDGKSRESLELLALRLNILDRCFFAGFRRDAHRYLTHYDVYVMSSYSEGFPLALLEAAQYKIPTVCSSIPIFQEIFHPDEVSFFELNNIPSLSDAIRRATNNKELGERMYARYIKDYTPENMYTHYQNIYNEKV